MLQVAIEMHISMLNNLTNINIYNNSFLKTFFKLHIGIKQVLVYNSTNISNIAKFCIHKSLLFKTNCMKNIVIVSQQYIIVYKSLYKYFIYFFEVRQQYLVVISIYAFLYFLRHTFFCSCCFFKEISFLASYFLFNSIKKIKLITNLASKFIAKYILLINNDVDSIFNNICKIKIIFEQIF